jgi:hypothetical protein
MANIQIKRERRADWDVIHYAGPMNEEAGLHLLPLFEDARSKCMFNFAGVTSVNSKGTGIWMNFLRTFRDGREIHLEEVAPCFVALINMMPSLTMGVKVRSIFVPFACDGCGMRLSKLIAFGGATPLSLSSLARSSHCSKCHELMELEEPSETYFMFALDAGLVVED